MDKQLEKLNKIAEFLEDGKPTRDEVAEAFLALAEIVKDFKQEVDKNFIKLGNEASKELDKLEAKLDKQKVSLETHASSMGGSIKSLQKKLQDEVDRLESIVLSVEALKGDKGDPGEKGEPGKDGADGNIKDLSPQEVRDSLELLQGDERLDKKAIRGLQESIDDVRKMASANAMPVTTNFFNGLRAKNLNIVGATATKDGDTVNITGIVSEGADPAAYGQISVDGGSSAQELTDQNVFYKITQFAENGISNNTTPDHTNDQITINASGVYVVSATLSLSSGGNNNTYVLGIFVDGVLVEALQAQRKLGAANDTGELSIDGILSLSANAVVDVRVKCTNTGSSTLTLAFGILKVSSVGSTGSGVIPGGDDGLVQFNDGGEFGGSKLKYNKVASNFNRTDFPATTGQVVLGDGFVKISVSDTEPTSPNVGDLWVDIN